MEKLYNLEYLEEISAGDRDFIIDMLNDFVINTPIVLGDIDRCLNVSDWAQMYKTLHKFIPTFDFVGAKNISKDLRNMEIYSRTQTNLELINPLLFKIKEYCNEIILEIKSDFNI
jgi:hypothetical protein